MRWAIPEEVAELSKVDFPIPVFVSLLDELVDVQAAALQLMAQLAGVNEAVAILVNLGEGQALDVLSLQDVIPCGGLALSGVVKVAGRRLLEVHILPGIEHRLPDISMSWLNSRLELGILRCSRVNLIGFHDAIQAVAPVVRAVAPSAGLYKKMIGPSGKNASSRTMTPTSAPGLQHPSCIFLATLWLEHRVSERQGIWGPLS
eukprot:CAMPEP_0117686022 /NCGR_PEP_ID=MMETSP0804-20121206/22166_1 /TAXON_ID=1074897 /ORGANISM="Tetraselmis astigmatica, Strain CCMP880" /LENGTH=202 /DNA_ID=CAMNT_0005497563 /DNA_START=350 /DNA_END=960 /DNA_ORIENTATION=+